MDGVKTHPKTMIIFRGPPGSGKTTLAKLLVEWTGCAYASLDDFRVIDGEYKFFPSREKWVIEEYHKAVKELIRVGERFIILDNVHSREWEYKKVYEMAEAAGYRIHVVEAQATIYECFYRQTHPVPFDKLKGIFDRWETPLSRTDGVRLDQMEELMAKFLKHVAEDSRDVLAVEDDLDYDPNNCPRNHLGHMFDDGGVRCLFCRQSDPNREEERERKRMARRLRPTRFDRAKIKKRDE